jgi:hypothetical protein
VIIAQPSNLHVFPVLCARAIASMRPGALPYVFSAHLLWRRVNWLQSVVSSHTACRLMTTSAAIFAQVHVLVTIPIDNRRCFTQTL